MPVSAVDTDSLLAVEVGSITTRALLFDVVDGQYRFVARGQAPSTAAAPFKDIREGVRNALEHLQRITGRKLLGIDQRLILPSQPDGTGVDLFAASLSAGPVIKTVVVGLLADVSLESVQRIARSTYTRVIESIALNDRRRPHEQIDHILRLQPDLFLVAGGTDGGATRSLQQILEITALVCHLLPENKRPAVLFAGNQELTPLVKETLQPITPALFMSPNVRPALEVEDLQPAQSVLNQAYRQIRQTQMAGVEEINEWSKGTLISTAYATTRMVRFLSHDAPKGILSVDIGAGHTTVVGGFQGETVTGVYTQLGLGEAVSGLLRYTSPDDIARWLPFEVSDETIQEYLYHKSLYPASVPATPEELALEQAVARQVLHLAIKSISKEFPSKARRPAAGLLPYFEPILAGGGVITQAPSAGQSLLLLLDAIQPYGITTVILDQNNIVPALGAAAGRRPILPVRVLDSMAFRYLATVVTPYVQAHLGTPVLRVRLIHPNGSETRADVKQGMLEVLPLSPGQVGRLYLQPLHNADIGLGPGKTRPEGFPVAGTALGVVIDARGRPLRFPADQVRRREIIKKWLWTVGG
ncbi:MAG: glutamate mutase L [Anaerolineales bacterium]|nr:glutamate mutase L [Anaerolineales bacterium]